MPHSQRVKTSAYGKSVGASRMSKLLAEEERCNSRCGSSYQRSGSGSSSTYFNSVNSSTATGSVKKDSFASSTSALSRSNHPYVVTAIQNDVLGSSDDSGSDFDVEAGSRHLSDGPATLVSGDWVNTSAAPPVNEFLGERDALGVNAGGLTRERNQGLHPLGWQDRYMSQPAKLHSKQFATDHGRPQRVSPVCPAQRSYRKGSSSKAPQTDDLTAPLLTEKKTRSFTDRLAQGESEEHAPVNVAAVGSKNRNASSVRRATQSTSMNGNALNRRKGTSQGYYGRRSRSEEVGAGHRDVNSAGDGSSRRGLSNLVCSSAADVLPSVSNSVLSSFACSSAADVLPSAPSSFGTSSNYRPRKGSRSLGLVEGEAGRSMDPEKQRGEEAIVVGLRENIQNGQAFHRSGLGESQPTRPSNNYSSMSEPLRTDFVTETSAPSSSTSSLLPNYRHWGRNISSSRQGDGLGSFYRSNSTLLESNPAFGEDLSNQWSARRRSLYGSQLDPMGRESRSSSRSFSHSRPFSSSWSVLREAHHSQSSLSGPPARPPPLPPSAVFAEPSASESSFATFSPAIGPDISSTSRASNFVSPRQETERSATIAPAETGSLGPSTITENRPRLTVEGLSEILSALEFIERDEDLSYEQILMLEATLLLGGIGLHDRYRDMRIDIDNMSYEELLALEERIGNVNTGLTEESVGKSVRVEMFTSPKVTCGYVPQEIEIKCSICQEEFEEAVELGILECGHSHHIACIKQWLLQKNQCPICKAPALP